MLSSTTAKYAVSRACGFKFWNGRLFSVSSSVNAEKKNPPLESILIANRGEIACRVIKTAKRLGIRTIAVYSEADSLAKHVEMADEAVLIGPAPSAQSYLREDRILDAVKQTKAQAVHPGYGFLSERSSFVHLLEDNNVIFIGPGSSAMNAMGDKIESKKIAKAAGVNIIPGFIGEVNSKEDVIRISNEIGYPVMIKASAGGGGKGLRIAWNDDQAVESFFLSKAEAKSSFGDDRMLIEKFIDNPRHIEVQLLMDAFGNGVAFPERECSIQRRNQKVTEEAPSPFIDAETRKAMGKQAVALAKAVGYKSAGTVEMLVDSQRKFYFLEMNTRLQVEHPITEQITNVDLVEEMIHIAAGEPLRMKQEDVKIDGWAFESRVYAENPLRNFLPSIGLLTHYKEPSYYLAGNEKFAHPKALRCDSGIREGSEISRFYDPMICKLVTWGKDRNEAMGRMREALDCYQIRGLNHNICFLRSILDHPRFIAGKLSTKFIAEEWPAGFKNTLPQVQDRNNLVAVSAVMKYLQTLRTETVNDQLGSFNPTTVQELFVQISNDTSKDEYVPVRVSCDDYEPLSTHGDSTCDVSFLDANGNPTSVASVNYRLFDSNGMSTVVCYGEGENNRHEVFVHVLGQTPTGFKLMFHGFEYKVACLTPRQHELSQHLIEKAKPDMSKFVISPMPGAVIRVFVSAGQKVEEGQNLFILEAMKMQNIIRAEKAGVIKSLKVSEGMSVETDEILVEWD